MKYVEVVLVFTTVAVMMSSVATAREFGDQIPGQQQQQQQQQLRISNIMAEAFLSEAGTLTCIGGGLCLNDMGGCCPGNYCKIYMWQGIAKCEWCPSAGDTCGALDSCCPGYRCDSIWPLNGKCV